MTSADPNFGLERHQNCFQKFNPLKLFSFFSLFIGVFIRFKVWGLLLFRQRDFDIGRPGQWLELCPQRDFENQSSVQNLSDPSSKRVTEMIVVLDDPKTL